MLKRIKNLLQDKAIYFSIFITIAIALLSLIKLDLKDLPLKSSDKLGHLIAYFFLMISWLYTFLKKKNFHRLSLYAILGCLIYGIVIEVLQGAITSYRTASYLDFVANSVGIAIAILTFHIFEKKIQLK